jgi:hypothetical protein
MIAYMIGALALGAALSALAYEQLVAAPLRARVIFLQRLR